jgi:hypothetical protein
MEPWLSPTDVQFKDVMEHGGEIRDWSLEEFPLAAGA